jgi:hypothetical protein
MRVHRENLLAGVLLSARVSALRQQRPNKSFMCINTRSLQRIEPHPRNPCLPNPYVHTPEPVLMQPMPEVPHHLYTRHAHTRLSWWPPGGARRLSSLACPRLAEMRCPCGTLLHHHLHHTRPHQGPVSVGCACCRAACTCLALASGRSGGWSCGPFQPPCRTHWCLWPIPGPDMHAARPGEGPCSGVGSTSPQCAKGERHRGILQKQASRG